MYGSTSLLTTPPRALLMCTLLLFALLRWMGERTPFLLPFFPPPVISSFWGTSAINSFGTQEVLLTRAGGKYSTGSSLLTSNLSISLTHLPFSIAHLAVTPLLTTALLPSVLPFLAPGGCFRTWVLITYQLFYLSLSLWSVAPKSVLLPSTFRKLAGMTWTLTVLLQRNTRLFFFPLQLLSFTLWH